LHAVFPSGKRAGILERGDHTVPKFAINEKVRTEDGRLLRVTACQAEGHVTCSWYEAHAGWKQAVFTEEQLIKGDGRRPLAGRGRPQAAK
jgi:uncharacterized protein YodC (DUF2158 family)